jgi:hypothetical protein
LEGFIGTFYFLFVFASDGIGIAIPGGRPKAVVPIADLPSRWDQTSRCGFATGEIKAVGKHREGGSFGINDS